MHIKNLVTMSALALLCACPSDKDEETGAETGASSSGDPSTGGSAETTSEPTTGSTGESTGSESTGSVTSECGELTDPASCNAVFKEESRCQWLEVQQIAVDMCVPGSSESRCVEVSVNDGGCGPCIFKDLGGGAFEVATRGFDDVSCQSDVEFESCSEFSEDNPPICDCFCPGSP